MPALAPLTQNFVLALLLGAVVTSAVLFILRSSSTLKQSLLWTSTVLVMTFLGYGTTGHLVEFNHLIIFLAGYVGGASSLILPLSCAFMLRLLLRSSTPVELAVLLLSGLIGCCLQFLRLRPREITPRALVVQSMVAALTTWAVSKWATELVLWLWLTAVGVYVFLTLVQEFDRRALESLVLDTVDMRGPLIVCFNSSSEVEFVSQACVTCGISIEDIKLELNAPPSLLRQCLDRTAPLSEKRTFTINGERRTFLVRLKKIDLLKGAPGVAVVLRDITTFTSAVESLQEFFALSPDAICMLDTNGFLQVSNGRLEAILGYSTQELMLNNLRGFVHPDDWPEVEASAHRLLYGGGQLLSFENRYRHKDGTYRWLSWSSTASKEELAIYAVVRDITEQKAKQAELLAATNKVAEHAALLELVQDAVIVRSMNHHILRFNTGAEKMYGYKASEALGCDANVLFKTRFRQIRGAVFLELMERGTWKGIVTQTKADGTAIMVESRWTIRRDSQGRPLEILEFCTDMTEKVALDRNLNRLASIVEQSHDAMLRISLDGVILSWNRGAERIYGYSFREIYNKKIHLLSTAHRYNWVEDMLSSVRMGMRVLDVDTFVRHKNGSIISTSCTMSPIRDGSGKLQATSVIIRDLTEQRLVEREVARLERFNVVGQLAAGIGHEIRNPMTTVRGFLQLFAHKPEMAPYQGQLKIVLGELDDANSIITEFLHLARNRPLTFERQQLNNIVRALLPLLRADALMQDKLVQALLGDIPELLLNDKEISQLIINLARNGLEAMPSGGELIISTYLEQGQVCMRVEDQGAGIPEGLLESIWLPFFTTKDRGTGLGLAVCEHIAMQHKASIDVVPSTQGTAFVVRFSL